MIILVKVQPQPAVGGKLGPNTDAKQSVTCQMRNISMTLIRSLVVDRLLGLSILWEKEIVEVDEWQDEQITFTTAIDKSSLSKWSDLSCRL